MKQQIKPLFSDEVEQPEYLEFDIFSKPYVSLVQIKTVYQNAEEIKTDFVSDEEVAAEVGPDYDPPCSQLTYEADIPNAKEQILERRKKNIHGILIIFANINFILPNVLIFILQLQHLHIIAICNR